MNFCIVYKYFLAILCAAYLSFLMMDHQLTKDIHNNLPLATIVETDTDKTLIQITAVTLPSLLSLSEVTKRPLFSSDRQPIVEDVSPTPKNESTMQAQSEKDIRIEVTGIVMSGDKKMAIIRDLNNNKEKTLFIGNDIDKDSKKWVLEKVAQKEIFLKNKINKEDKELLINAPSTYYNIEKQSLKIQ
ncbi:MAG: hypothetical protein ACI9D5_002458 [Candidatus Endobugula sp.]|jgi:hypothetical protein